jgi:hypothetical protein
MTGLPSENDPLVLADGTKIDPATGAALRNQIEIPTNREAVERVVSVSRELIDLPAPPAHMNVMSLVAMYEFMGLRTEDIGIATGLVLTQIEQIKAHESYAKVVEMITESVLAADTDDVRQMIAKHTMTAAQRIGTLMDSESDAISLAASKDILDRSGHRPADVVEHRHMMEGALTIVHVKRDESDSLPTLELEGVEVEEEQV